MSCLAVGARSIRSRQTTPPSYFNSARDIAQTVEAPGGQAGLDRLASEPVDLIISDITMPKMNGYQFFRSVKEQFPEHADTPFIFLTALTDRDSEFKGLRLGVDDYITKPIDFDLLMLRVEIHLRRRPPVCLLYTSPSPRDQRGSRMPSSA